jgi:hypothetical protein
VPTLVDLIAAHEAARPRPVNRPTSILTPRGDATVAVYRLTRALAQLDPADREYVLDLVRGLVADTDRPA